MHTQGEASGSSPSLVRAVAVAARGRLLPLKVLVTLVVTIPIAIAAGTLVFIAVATSRSAAEHLGNEIVTAAVLRATNNIETYLDDAMRIGDLYERRVRTGTLPIAGLGIGSNAWLGAMFEDLLVQPNVASICIGTPSGDSTWLLRHGPRLEFGRSDGARDCAAIEFVVDRATGKLEAAPIRTYRYDPRARPWYSVALKQKAPVWTPVYFWFGEQGSAAETGTGHTRVIRDAQGKVLGVLVIDVTLGALSQYLRQLPLASSGYAYLLDEQGMLVAASHGAVNSADGKRLRLDQSDSPAARAVAGRVGGKRGSSDPAADEYVEIEGRSARVRATPLALFPGINWRLVAVLPEDSYMEPVYSLRWRAAITAAVAVLGSLYLGLRLSRRLSDPLLRLTEHVDRVGAGDFDARLMLENAREFQRLSQQLNRMAAGLKHRVQLQSSVELARHVQQSLVPENVPKVAGLDIAASSRFCDETGGDYYDFLDLSCPTHGANKSNCTIAIGDVMGHGLGSALLMATARGALRASMATGACLDTQMSHVNYVLASDVRHGMFMTMTILAIDPKQRQAQWVCAGHEPILVYDPDAQTFSELSGGDLPLGIEVSARYSIFTRTNLPANAILFLGTDGIWESRNSRREEFGKDRLRQCIRENASRSAADIATAIEREVRVFTAQAPIRDDATCVVLKFL